MELLRLIKGIKLKVMKATLSSKEKNKSRIWKRAKVLIIALKIVSEEAKMEHKIIAWRIAGKEAMALDLMKIIRKQIRIKW